MENLNVKKVEYENAVDAYSPIWLIKQYQKNLNRIQADLNKIISAINQIEINHVSTTYTGVTRVYFTNIQTVSIQNLTIGNHKAKYVRDSEQKSCDASIRTLHANLMNLVNTMNSLTIGSNFHPHYTSYAVNRPFCPIMSVNYSAEYNFLSNNIVGQYQAMLNVHNSFKQFTVTSHHGVIREATYGQRLNPQTNTHETYQISAEVRGIVSVTHTKPNLQNFHSPYQLSFRDHARFKQTRREQQINLDQISQTHVKIDYKNRLVAEINNLEYQLTDEYMHKTTQNQLNQCIKEFPYKDLLQIINTKTIVIEKQNMLAAFGAVSDRLSFRKWKLFKRAPKPHLRTSITFQQFFKNLWKVTKTENKLKNKWYKSNLKQLSEFKFMNIGTFTRFLVDEEIVGSFYVGEKSPQNIVQGKVDENYDQALFQVCENLALVALNEREEVKTVQRYRDRFRQLEESFWSTVESYKPGLKSKLNRFYGKSN